MGKFYWYTVAGAAALVTGVLAVVRDRQANSFEEKAVEAKTALTMALSGAGQPLIAALSEVAASDTLAATESATKKLVNRTVGVAQEESGRYSEEECHTRAAFYRFVGEDLELAYNEGRHGSKPRRSFLTKGTAHDQEAIRVANSDNGLNCSLIDYERDSSAALHVARAVAGVAFIVGLLIRRYPRLQRWLAEPAIHAGWPPKTSTRPTLISAS